MTKSEPLRPQRELEKAFAFIIQLADGQTKINERLSILFENTANLESRLENARGETIVLAKVVAHMMGRDCVQDRNPAKRLDELLARYFAAAEVFAHEDDGINAEWRKVGIDLPDPTAKGEQKREQDLAIAETYRSTANHVRDEALKIIHAAQR